MKESLSIQAAPSPIPSPARAPAHPPRAGEGRHHPMQKITGDGLAGVPPLPFGVGGRGAHGRGGQGVRASRAIEKGRPKGRPRRFDWRAGLADRERQLAG